MTAELLKGGPVAAAIREHADDRDGHQQGLAALLVHERGIFDGCLVHGGHHHGRHEFGAPVEPFYNWFYMVPHGLMLWISCQVN